jgi:hypothetical protein
MSFVSISGKTEIVVAHIAWTHELVCAVSKMLLGGDKAISGAVEQFTVLPSELKVTLLSLLDDGATQPEPGYDAIAQLSDDLRALLRPVGNSCSIVTTSAIGMSLAPEIPKK